MSLSPFNISYTRENDNPNFHIKTYYLNIMISIFFYIHVNKLLIKDYHLIHGCTLFNILHQ